MGGPMVQPHDNGDVAAASGLDFCGPSASDAVPRYIESDVLAPTRMVGVGTTTTLKATFWDCKLYETVQQGDPDFVAFALMTDGHAWRNTEANSNVAGGISMMPFEGANWRFDGRAKFVQFYVPFELLGTVSESLFDRELLHSRLRMPSCIRDRELCSATYRIERGLSAIEPTKLILDSWALILSDIFVRRYSSHAGRQGRTSFGKIPARSFAQVIDYIEANIHLDLDLASLAGVAAMSVYHFARRFKETAGVSPHAYVLSRRVRHAREMLKGGGSLAYVASACGFAGQSHMTTAFRHGLGVTPGEYRRSLSS